MITTMQYARVIFGIILFKQIKVTMDVNTTVMGYVIDNENISHNRELRGYTLVEDLQGFRDEQK